MIKTTCKKCKRLNLININVIGSGKIQMPCKFCGNKMIFDGKNKLIIKPNNAIKETEPIKEELK